MPVMTSPEEALPAPCFLQGFFLLLLLLFLNPSCSSPSASPLPGRLGWCCLPWHLQELNRPSKRQKLPAPEPQTGPEGAQGTGLPTGQPSGG